MEKISWNYRVKNEVLQMVKEKNHFLLAVKQRKAKWIGSNLAQEQPFETCY